MQNESRKIGHYGAYEKTGAIRPAAIWTQDMARTLAQKYDVAHLSRNEYSLLLRDLRCAGVITTQEFSAGYGGTLPHGRIPAAAPPEPLPFGDDERTDFAQLLKQYAGYCGECLKASAGNDLTQEFQDLSEKLLGSYEDLGYPNGLFIYKSESAIAALDRGAEAAVEKLGLTNFSIPDYKAEGLNCYYNFNSAYSNNLSVSEQYFLDYDQVPPEGFQWFYQTGGTGEVQKSVEAELSAIYAPDGKLIWSREPEEAKPFDPTDPLSATTWVSYRDANGKEHRVSTDFRYTHTDSDLFNLASLLNFSGGDSKLDAAANRFLSTLQVYPKWYFGGQTTKMFA